MVLVNCHGGQELVVTLLILVLAVVAAPMKDSQGVLLHMIPKYSRNSPINPGNLSKIERYARMVQSSKMRVARLSSQRDYAIRKKQAGSHPDLVTPKLFQVLDSTFVVKVSIGEQGTFFLDMDTGTDLIWVQSSDCNPCFPSVYSYDRTRSDFEPLRARDALCGPQTWRDPQGICTYDDTYGEGSTSRGLIGKDKFFTYSADRRRSVLAGKLLFGVAQQNRDIVWGANAGPHNIIAGLFGMGRSDRSFISQLSRNEGIPKRFSYCLRDWDSDDRSPTLLKVGAYANQFPAGSHILSTPLLHHARADDSLYFVNLRDISVGGKRLGLPSGIFDIHNDGTNGIIFDSGTPLIHMMLEAYEVVDEFLTEIFEDAGLETYVPSEDETEERTQLGAFCWTREDKDGDDYHDFPEITLHFEGADLDIDTHGAYVIFDHFFCVAIAPIPHHPDTNSVNVLGALSMTNYHIMHDIDTMSLFFAKTGC